MKLQTNLYIAEINTEIPVYLEFEVTEDGVTEHHIYLDIATSGVHALRDTVILNDWFQGDNDDKFEQFEEECLEMFNDEQEGLELDYQMGKLER